jgi:CheY-like chemotaxis protein
VIRILLVDDDPIVRKSIRMALNDPKFEITDASDGRKALAAAKDNQFDLVITDLLMPNSDGLELIGQLRALTPAIKILAISGGGKVLPGMYLNLAKKLGADATLPKPFRLPELLEAVTALTSGQ